MPSTSSSSHAALVALAAARWRIGLGLTAAMTFIYSGDYGRVSPHACHSATMASASAEVAAEMCIAGS